MIKKQNVYKNDIAILLSLACILTNLSQLPFFINLGKTQYLSVTIWLVIVIYICLFKRKITISRGSSHILIVFGILFFFMILFQLLKGELYVNSTIFLGLMMSIYIYIVGDICTDWINERNIKLILNSYCLSTLYVSFAIFIEYFSNGLGLDSRVYVFESKNSFAQIAFVAAIIFLFMEYNKSKLGKVLQFLIVVFLCFFIMILRSRATILGLAICLMSFAVMKTSNKKVKLIVWICGITFVILLITNENFNNIIFNQILFSGRDLNNIDDLSSGRLTIIESFPMKLNGEWLTGIGNIYFECFPLSAILNYGIIIGIIFIVVSYYPLMFALKNKRKSKYHEMFFFIALGFIVNSFFEGLAPLGPGAKCYILWLLFGILQKKGAIYE